MNESTTSDQNKTLNTQLKYNAGLTTNNFDLLRFIFAFIVFLVHSYALSDSKSLSILSELLSSGIAVKSFFIVSGFLIFMSYENSHNVKSYFLKRVRRIYPAYCFVILFCAIFGYIFSTYSFDQYWSFDLVKYIAANLIFLNFLSHNLPGVFENNPLQAVNGALWTLKIEVMFYLFVPIVAMAFKRFNRLAVMISLYVISVLYSVFILGMQEKTGAEIYGELQRQLPGQLTFFMAGAAGYYYYSFFKRYSIWLVMLALVAFAFKSSLPWLVIQPVALAILVIYFACIFPYLGNFGKYGDFSYGIYIIHCPILQVLVLCGFFNSSPWITLSVSVVLILFLSFILWHFIEKPFLRRSSHYLSVGR